MMHAHPSLPNSMHVYIYIYVYVNVCVCVCVCIHDQLTALSCAPLHQIVAWPSEGST